MKKSLSIKFIIFISVITVITLPQPADAQAFALEVSPPLIQIEVNKPPASINTPIAIQNTSDKAVTLEIQMRPFKSAKTEDGRIDLQTGNIDPRYTAIFSTMQIQDNGHSVSNVTLSPGQEKHLVFHVGLSKNQAP